MNQIRFGLLAALALPVAAQAANGDTMMFTLRAVIFKGNSLISTDTLMAATGLTIGQKVDRDNIVTAFNNVSAEYQKDNVNGTIQPTMAVSGSHMTVTFNITDEAKVPTSTKAPTLGHETFTGNVKISNEALQGALTLKPGQDVSRDAVVADLNAITALYKAAKVSATIQPQISNIPGGTVDINFEITEGKVK